MPVDRHYIERFLTQNASYIRGRVLELNDNRYTLRFGGAQVNQSDVLAVEATNPNATLVGNLERSGTLPEAAFDCIILTQTLQYIYDLHAGIDTVYHALKPGGVALITTPGVTPMEDVWPWYWSLTTLALRRLLEERFGRDAVSVEAHGNIFAVIAFLHGLAIADLDISDLNLDDSRYPVIVTARVIKRRSHEHS